MIIIAFTGHVLIFKNDAATSFGTWFLYAPIWTLYEIPESSDLTPFSAVGVGPDWTPFVKGCILLGSGVGYLNDDRAVLSSGNAIYEFMIKTIGVNEIDLEIV